jgi:predicted dehydrogenase
MRIGIIGYGRRIRTVISEIMKQHPDCKLAAIVDVKKDEIISASADGSLDEVQWYDDSEQMMKEAELDGVLIGTRCSLHTEMAVKVLPYGKPVFLEKPVATSYDDLFRLKACSEQYDTKAVVSFPLRMTGMVQMVKEIIDSGKIGTVEHVQAVNNVTYGGVYFHDWYRDENETGGLFLQKATHDFDYINYVLQMKPVQVCAMTSKQIFKGDKPAGLKCVDCEENRTCPESTAFAKEPIRDKLAYCCFASDTGNEDSGSALIRYESGMHVSYSQNFFVRNKANSRGARFMGYKGTLEFDFYTHEVTVKLHHTSRVESYRLDAGKGHFGGDSGLAGNFIGLMSGEAEQSVSPLQDGLLSALLCLKARESAATGTFQSVDWNV